MTSSTAEALRPAPVGEERLRTSTVVAYSLPLVGYGYLFMLTSLYLVKFSTDVLLVPAGVIGTIYGLSKFWDAFSDPLAGHLSDRTRARLGRRRPWLLAAVLPIVVAPVMVWSPPASLEGAALAAWMTVAVFGFYTATTLFNVPHTSLGAELSLSYHERTRIYAYRHAAYALGTFLMIGALYWLTTSSDKRGTALILSAAGGAFTAAFVLYAIARLRERPEFRDRGGRQPFRAFGDVLRNGHARLLLFVFLIENVGTASLGILGPYVLQYIIGDESKFPLLLLAYLIPAVAFVPLGPPLSRRFGKKNVWAASMVLSGLAFGGLFFAGAGDYLWICGCGTVAGIGNAWGNTVGPSIQADVVDYDEYRTGQRNEGAYFAAWSLVQKMGFGLSAVITTVALELVGYEPNVEQTEGTKLLLMALFSLFPAASYAVGFLLFLRFRLTEDEHRRIRAELDTRAEGA